MSDLRSGKRKEHDAAIGTDATVAGDIVTESSGHMQKQHKSFGADMKPFCAGVAKPAYPSGLHQRRSQAVRPLPRPLSPPARTHSPTRPAPLSWRPGEMSPQMQAAHIKQQHAARMATLLQHLPGQSLSDQLAAQTMLQDAAERQLCDAAYTRNNAVLANAGTFSEQCNIPGQTATAATFSVQHASPATATNMSELYASPVKKTAAATFSAQQASRARATSLSDLYSSPSKTAKAAASPQQYPSPSKPSKATNLSELCGSPVKTAPATTFSELYGSSSKTATATTFSGRFTSPGRTSAAVCWSTSPTAGLTRLTPGSKFTSLNSTNLDQAKAPKPWEQLSFQYGKVVNSPSPLSQHAGPHRQTSPLSQHAGTHRQTGSARGSGLVKPMTQAGSGQGSMHARTAYNLADFADDGEDADLQVALEASMATFEVEQLRATAEPLPMRAANGPGMVWQNDLDSTVQAHKAPKVHSHQHQAATEPLSNTDTKNEADPAEQPKGVKEISSKAGVSKVQGPNQATGPLHNEDIEVLKALSIKELQAYGPCMEACTLDGLCEDVDQHLQLEDSYNQNGSDATDVLSLACSEELIEMEEADDMPGAPSMEDFVAVCQQPEKQSEKQQAKADENVDEWVVVDKDAEEFHI